MVQFFLGVVRKKKGRSGGGSTETQRSGTACARSRPASAAS
jgi:hypothetical protein